MKNFLIAITLFFFISFGFSLSQEKLRLMSYNILNYPNSRNSTSITSIEPHYKNIINKINPDLLVVVEMVQQSGVQQFLNNVLGNEFNAANVVIRSTNSSGYDGNDCAFYYKPSKVKLIESKAISARTRVISSFKVVSNFSNDTLVILGVHLKANEYNSADNNLLNQQKRTDAVISLRNETDKFLDGKNFLVCGDFNIFSSDEQAFQKLIDKSKPGYFIDFTNSIGNWSGDPKFSSVCTYSASKLDTRLDMILISQSLVDKGGIDYINNSYKIFGNDGNQFNRSVANTSNSWFFNEPSLAVSTTTASDHLPIYADFEFGVKTDINDFFELPSEIKLEQNYPNPFNPTTTIKFNIGNYTNNKVSIKLYDVLGNEISTLVDDYKKPGSYELNFNAKDLSSGVYFYKLQVGNFVQTKKMILIK
ncbi:MAG: T9SS type A sorting domain-containing protein [Melioribacteraceae bacterium]|nr:T9SS type A sorting domain-containing protein [Melioribacteraceae bacterium]